MTPLELRRNDLISAAAKRLGLTLKSSYLQYDPCFDDSLLLHEWPIERKLSVIDWDSLPENPAERVRALSESKYIFFDPDKHFTDDGLLAAACSCVSFSDRKWIPDLHPMNAIAPVAFRDDIAQYLNERITPELKQIIPSLGFYGGDLREELRRWVTGNFSASLCAVRNSMFDLAAFDRHLELAPRASDAYMWYGERLLIAALAWALPDEIPGAVIEIGVGSGGTFSVMVAFSRNRSRHFYAYDDSSYGGDKQWAEFEETMAPWRGQYQIMRHVSQHSGLNEPIAFLHVDGDHSEAGCRGDLEKFATQVAPGGILVVDDLLTRDSQANVGKATWPFIRSGNWDPIASGPKLGIWRKR